MPEAPPPGAVRRILARNAVWNAASYVLHAAALLVISPYVVEHLGKDLFGVWIIVQTLIGYLNIADFGIRPAIVHFVARHDARGEHGALNRAVNSAFLTLACGGTLVVIAASLLAPHLGAWFDVPAAQQAEAGWALVVAAVLMACILPLNAFTAVLIGKQRFDLSCRVDLISLLANAIGVVTVLATGGGIVVLAAVIGSVELCEMLVKARLAFKEQPRLRFEPRLADRSSVRALLSYGGANLVVMASLLLADKTDAIVIGGAMSAMWVTLFDRAAKMPIHARSMIFQVGRVLMPELGAREARGDRAGVAHLLAASSRNVLLAAGPVLVYLLVLGGAFLETWMHGDASFRVEAGSSLILLALTAAFPIASYPLVTAHQGTNRMGSLAIVSIVEGLANLGLSLWLVQSHGIWGVALGTAVPAAIVHGLVLPCWNGRLHGFSPWVYLAEVWPIPLLSGAVTYGALRAVFDTEASYGWPALIAGALGAVAVFAATGYALVKVRQRMRAAPRLRPEVA